VNISIVSGWLPVVVQVVAAVVLALVLAMEARAAPGTRRIVCGAGVALVVTALGLVVIRFASPVSADVPWSAYGWGFLFVLAVWVGAAGWAGGGRPWRAAAVVAMVLTLLVTLGNVDRQTGTFPTLGRLVTLDPEDVVGMAQLQQLRSEVAATGTLPSQGVVTEVVIPPKASHFSTRPAYVYLPPAWFARSTPSLPTLILLPGEPGSAADWSSDGDADNTADAFARTHHGVAPIIVMPDPDGYATLDSECVNSRFGNAETYLVQDVPAFARSVLHASTRSGSLAIGGLSAGGTCSVMLALRHPDVFPTFASYSGFASPQYEETTRSQTVDILFGGSRQAFDDHDPAFLVHHGHFTGLAGWFEVGDQDTQPLEAAHTLQPAARSAGIATCLLVRPGGHDFDLWSQALSDSFPWLAWRLGLTGEPASEPAACASP
jgi:S-formylglutathione hydrolase FrmB